MNIVVERNAVNAANRPPQGCDMIHNVSTRSENAFKNVGGGCACVRVVLQASVLGVENERDHNADMNSASRMMVSITFHICRCEYVLRSIDTMRGQLHRQIGVEQSDRCLTKTRRTRLAISTSYMMLHDDA